MPTNLLREPESDSRPRQVSPSNRGETSSKSEPSGLGVDRLSVAFQVRDFQPDCRLWRSVSQSFADGELASETYSASIEVEGAAPVFVGVKVVMARLSGGVVPGQGPVFGKVEFNPSRFVDPDGFGLASLSDCLDAFPLVVNSAGALVEAVHSDDFSSYSLRRVDVAKDFHSVVSPSALIRGLAPIPRKWARKNLVHADPSRNGAQTLLVGSNSGAARLYDKCAETKGKAPSGTVRCEIESRTDWLRNYGGVSTVADLHKLGVNELGQNRFEWSAMGVEVKSSQGVVAALVESELSPRERCAFLGWLVMQSSEFAYTPAKATLAKYRKIQRDLNITLGVDAADLVGFSTQLDWESGEVIVRVC